jgi:hypothetical protein
MVFPLFYLIFADLYLPISAFCLTNSQICSNYSQVTLKLLPPIYCCSFLMKLAESMIGYCQKLNFSRHRFIFLCYKFYQLSKLFSFRSPVLILNWLAFQFMRFHIRLAGLMRQKDFLFGLGFFRRPLLTFQGFQFFA